MVYKMDCPAMCGTMLTVESENKDGAVAMMKEKMGAHMKEAHPDQPMDDAAMSDKIVTMMSEEGGDMGGSMPPAAPQM